MLLGEDAARAWLEGMIANNMTAFEGNADVVRAAVEGVTDGLAFALDALGRTGTSAERLVLVGGGANSDRWGQLVADMTSLPVDRPSGTEAAAEGAARQARWVIDGYATLFAEQVKAGIADESVRRLGDVLTRGCRAAPCRRAAASGSLRTS